MAQSFQFRSGAIGYVRLLRDFRIYSHHVSPRGMGSFEIEDCSVTITNATLAVPLGTTRKVRQAIGVTEYLQLLAGVSWLEQLDEASGGNFSQFSDGGRLRGAYGPRIHGQLAAVAGRLEEDPDSRQAVVSVWGRDGDEVGCRFLDTPCTLAFQFRIRKGALNMTAFMRSSDVWLGLPYDLWMFSRLQMTMAWALRVPAGSLTVTAGSMHMYDRDYQKAQEVALTGEHHDESAVPPAVSFDGHATFSAAERLGIAQVAAEELVLGRNAVMTARGTEWNANALPVPSGEWHTCMTCRYVVPGTNSHCKECP